MKYKIYCDMDQVIVDFDKAFLKLTGYAPKHYEDTFGKSKFWTIIGNDSKFWSKMEWMPDGKKLWGFIKYYKPELLSAPSSHISSRIGKQHWVDTHLPGVKLNLAKRADKHLYSDTNHILIDDNLKTIQEWNTVGGIGIHHTDAIKTIDNLKKFGF